MYEIWKLYVKNYSSYHVRTKLLTKFRCDLDLSTPKWIGINLLPSCIYVWNMKTVRWKLLKLSCQNQSVDGQTDGQTDRRTNLILLFEVSSASKSPAWKQILTAVCALWPLRYDLGSRSHQWPSSLGQKLRESSYQLIQSSIKIQDVIAMTQYELTFRKMDRQTV